MTTPSDEVYKQIISIQNTLYDQHNQVREELDSLKMCIYHELNGIKQDLHERLSPMEEKITKHEQTFNVAGKMLAWIGLPSGAGILGFLCWLFQPHK